MTLTDAGPLIAFLDDDDRHHRACLTVAQNLPPGPLLTTWPCFSEAMFILHARGGYRYQAELWKMYLSGRLTLHDSTPAELVRMAQLMDDYKDTPMDLADASLWRSPSHGGFVRSLLSITTSGSTASRTDRRWNRFPPDDASYGRKRD